jgi:acetyl esterase/lipase
MKSVLTTLLAFVSISVASSAAAQVRVVADVDYVASAEYADKKDRLDIYVPDGARNAPVIIAIHGGGLRGGDKSGQTGIGQRLASAGHVTVVVNHRLSPGVSHPAHIEDIATAVAWVKKNIATHGGDPGRVFVIGHSAGAYLAALLATDRRYLAAHGMRPQDIRGFVPVSAFFYVDRQGVAPDRPKDTWGTDVNVWKSASPGTHIESGLPPFLLLYADGDDEWRRKQQTEFAGAMRAKGNRDIETREIAGRTHNSVWFDMAKGEEETSRAIVDFVRRLTRDSSR